MSLQSEISRSFRLYVTHVDGEGHFLKISGQLDQQSSLMIETLFETARESLEQGIGSVPPGAIKEGIICAAKYKDGTYYRAKIINTTSLPNGLVGVHFIDYGNKDIISLSTIRFLENYDPMFLQLRGQASDYYLSRVMHHAGRWEEPLLLKLQSLLCYAEYPATIEATTRTFPIISVQFKGTDLSTHLVSKGIGVAIPTARQEVLLVQIVASESQQMANWPPSFANEAPSFTEHVPFLVNQNFPSNPASAMRQQQNVLLPFNGSVPPPSLISQRLLVNNKVSRNPVNLKAPSRQPQHATGPAPAPPLTMPPPMPLVNKPVSPKKSTTYKSRLLEVGSTHKVFVSFAEEGPDVFAVQLVTDARKLQDMMDDINRRPHSSLAEPPMIGTVCLGRMSGDRIICRAIVMNLSGSQCKLFFVDFGDTEMVSYYDIFDIPEEFVKPNVFAMRFCLSGVKKLEKGPHLNETFKQLVNGKVLTLRVVSPEGPPLIQYGELYLDNKNVLDLLLTNIKDKLEFQWVGMLPLGSRMSVLVSYVDSCLKFFVQLSEKIDELNAVMDAVKAHCETSTSPGDLPVGAACCARFPDDDNWYRARIRNKSGKKITVAYVDYGNEQEVDVSDLRTITPDLIKLPAQALKCALKGFENKPVESKTSNQLEMLALEKTLMAHVAGVVSNDTMLVSLVNDTENPPLDIARRMTQLSTPRSVNEPKVTTPVRKDPPESFSSPEGSEKKAFRREKSFKDDRRPPREPRENRDGGSEEFGQRGGSFRSRDSKESFDRTGPGRHSEKFGGRDGRPERNDRRGGKPWENNPSSAALAPAPAASPGDDWEDTPSAAAPPPRSNHNSRRNTRPERPDRSEHHSARSGQHEKGPRPGWKGKDAQSGVSKRLRQATDAASQDSHSQRPFSVQDRLKRDNKFNNQQNNEWEENKQDDWKSRTENKQDDWKSRTENKQDDWKSRPDRRDNRGDRRDNWGDKKDNFQKREFRDNNRESRDSNREFRDSNREFRDSNREFRDNNRERGDRTRSNFTPRDRAERSFGSDNDKRSEKSFKSQDNGGHAGRAPPYKSRSKFTQVQYKELPDPIPLETPFEEPVVDTGAQHEVSVTWIISPESFYTQILSLQPKFLDMMHKIPELYKGVKSYTGIVPVGASVLARYPADGVLYRATVVSIQPFSKFIVQYVDFGNKQLVDAKDIWQLDQQLMELPKMAVHCSLLGVSPKDGEWKANPEIDLCFNAPRYQCVFQDCFEGQWKVTLWNNGASVGDMLVEKELAVLSEHQSSVTLKDEAIDLTIIVGQQILCRVTHVESHDKFYIQLDLDKAALVESAIANFDITKLTPLAADSLAEGIHCTVKHEDKIYRAILEDVGNTESIKAVLPDYGHSITTTLANLMILPTELSVYYYQSLECGLNNYTAESTCLMTVEQMKEKLAGNKFIIYINYVDGIRVISTLYEIETGQKVAIFEPDEGAYDEVVQLCTRAVFNYNFGLAYISHAENLNEFYLQKSTDSDKIAQLLDELYKFYEEGSPEALASFEVDGLCAAKSSDGNWYRATIVSAEENDVKVQFVDYGNAETVPKDNLKKLDTKFFETCALALVAGLGLVALQEDALPKLLEWTTDKEVQVTLAFGTAGWLASLHLDGVDLSIKLVNEKLATPKVGSEEEQKTEAPAEKQEPVSLPSGCAQVYISHIDTPGHFWLQMIDKVDKIEEIQADLQANATNYPDIENRELGTLCVAKYLADEKWYRAEILDADSDITTVRFIDYGNTDVLDNQPGLIKVIPDTLKEIERYAVKSSVNAVPTGMGEWSEAASESFTTLVGDLSNPVDALIVLKDVTTYVDIFVNGHNITDKLVAEGYASKSEEPECGDLPSCFASHINSPSEFWIQLETAAPELQAMEAAMVDAENFPELTDREEGVLCAAKYPEDGSWYRAQVIVDGSEGTEVLFMDYGNASIANELRSLPDELKAKPALSRKCALQKPRDIKTWSRQSENKFNELAAEGATIFNVQFIASGDISIVELYLEGKSVTEELVGLCEAQSEAQPTVERPTPVGQDQRSSGKICHVNSLYDFYVQLDEFGTVIDNIIVQLTGAADFEPAVELKVGSLCAAFWAEDEKWYRAKILEFCDEGYHVLFIDYGNKAKCTEFKQLPEDLMAIEPASKCCHLAAIDTSLSEIAKNKLDDYAAEAETFQIEFLDSTKEPALVKLFIDGKDFCAIISAETNKPELHIENIPTKDENMAASTESPIHESNPPTEDATNVIEDSEEIVQENSENTPVQESIEAEANMLINTNVEADIVVDVKDSNEAADDDGELNKSQDLNDSLGSNNTVIENKSFEGKADSSSDEFLEARDESPAAASPEPDLSTETLENSNDTIKTPERDISKDSLNTDTGYTSGGEHEKLSPMQEETSSPVKEADISGGEHEKLSPMQEETSSPVKEADISGGEHEKLSPMQEKTSSPVKEADISGGEYEKLFPREGETSSPVKGADSSNKDQAKSPKKDKVTPESPEKEESKLPESPKEKPKLSESPKKEQSKLTQSPKKVQSNLTESPNKEELIFSESRLPESPKKEESRLPESPKKEESRLPESPKKEESRLPESPKKEESRLPESPIKEESRLPESPKKEESELPEAPKKEESKLPESSNESGDHTQSAVTEDTQAAMKDDANVEVVNSAADKLAI